MVNEMTVLYDEIRALMGAPRAPRARVETTLTDGYAHALGLEAERVRIQRRIGELVGVLAGVGDGTPAGGACTNELADLARQLKSADEELGHLRGLLSTLRAHAYA
jgi:hypothetical protein